MGLKIGNGIMTFLSKMVDAAILSTFWVICCLPVFTIGAASTSLYYAVHKSLARSRGYIWKSYWGAFKDNFKSATLSWLVQLAIMLVIGMDIWIMHLFAGQNTAYTVLFYMFCVLMALLIVWFHYTIAYQARFENGVKNTLKNAAAIAFLNLPWSVLMLIILVITILIIILIPIFLFFLPAVMYLIFDTILERIFRGYMKPEDLEHELENDMLDRE